MQLLSPKQLFGNPVQQDGGADADNDAGDHTGDDQDGHIVEQLRPGNGKHRYMTRKLVRLPASE